MSLKFLKTIQNYIVKKKSLVKKLNFNFKKMLKQTSDESILEVWKDIVSVNSTVKRSIPDR